MFKAALSMWGIMDKKRKNVMIPKAKNWGINESAPITKNGSHHDYLLKVKYIYIHRPDRAWRTGS